MIRSAFIAVFSFAAGVLVYDTALDHQRAAAAPTAPQTMPAADRQPRMQHPLPDCDTWVAQRGPNERWVRRCAPAADLTKRG